MGRRRDRREEKDSMQVQGSFQVCWLFREVFPLRRKPFYAKRGKPGKRQPLSFSLG
jgi:hypothetical protein